MNPPSAGGADGQKAKRPFLGVYYECCHTYGRLYPNPLQTAYQGRCPKCLRALRIRIDPNAATTKQRFFRFR